MEKTKRVPGWGHTSEPNEIMVFLTSKCNMSCDYCYVSKDKKPRPDTKSIKKNIGKILNAQNNKIRKITFTGGEPLIYFDEIKDIISFCGDINQNIRFQINTNCTLITSKTCEFINKNSIILAASIDGKMDAHDKHRKFKDGSGSFESIIKNIRGIDKKLVNVHMVLNPGYRNIFKNINVLYNAGLRNFYIEFNILADWSKDSLKKIREELRIFKKDFIKNYTKHKGIKILNLEKILFALKGEGKNKCDYITIDPDGNICSCHIHQIMIKKASEECSFNDLKIRRKKVLSRIKGEIINKKEKCVECQISPFCSCPVDLYMWKDNTDFERIHKSICFLARELVNCLLVIKDFLDYKEKISFKKVYGVPSIREREEFAVLLNKRINQIWFSLTNKCTFSCNYCFVPKGSDSMDIAIINNALDVLLMSKGKNKKLIIFGGEPLMEFGRIKTAIQLAKIKAAFSGKKIEFGLGTNGSISDSKILEYLKENEVQVSISMDGKEESHNKRRIFKDKSPSFSAVEKNIRHFEDFLPEKNISCLFGVHHTEAKNISENFRFLIEAQKFRSINIEPIQTEHVWTKEEKKMFVKELITVFNYIEQRIKKNEFIFLNKMSQMLKNFLKGSSMILDTLTFFPDGKITLNVFLYYLNKKYIIGDTAKGITNLNPTSFGGDLPDSAVDCTIVRLRNLYIKKFAGYIINKGKQDKRYKEYIEEAKKRVFE